MSQTLELMFKSYSFVGKTVLFSPPCFIWFDSAQNISNSNSPPDWLIKNSFLAPTLPTTKSTTATTATRARTTSTIKQPHHSSVKDIERRGSYLILTF